MTQHALKTAVAVLALGAGLGLAGCGATETHDMDGAGAAPSSAMTPSSPMSSMGSASPATSGKADVTFLKMMLPHHQQAVAMSDTLLAKSDVDPDVSALARQIKDAQAPEITTMEGLLTSWGQDTGTGMGGMDQGMAEDGMATDEELATLDQADGPAAQKLYLQLMTRHHEGAVAMAQTEISDGESSEAVQLARDIVSSQQQELTTMGALLAGM